MRLKSTFKALAALSMLALCNNTFAQQGGTTTQSLVGKEANAISTAVPFLLIVPESRGSAMGDAGVATKPDANSIHFNAAKMVFNEKKFGASVSYSPWLSKLVNDINLAYISGFYKLNDRQAIAGSIRYFDLGSITFTDNQGNNQGDFNPKEFAIDLSYSQKLSDNLSLAITPRFIRSDLASAAPDANGTGPIKAGVSVAADVSLFHTQDFEINNKDARFAYGVNISNIGNKLTYTTQERASFIPTNLRIGAAQTIAIDDYNEITLTLDINKLLVPTQPFYIDDSTGNISRSNPNGNYRILAGKDPNRSVGSAIFSSFADAPGGFKEELQELQYSTGLEYWYDKQFAFRGGYFYENPLKGNRKYVTFGAGLRYSYLTFDLSYLVSLTQQNPLENTLRFTLKFEIEDSKPVKAEPKS